MDLNENFSANGGLNDRLFFYLGVSLFFSIIFAVIILIIIQLQQPNNKDNHSTQIENHLFQSDQGETTESEQRQTE